MLDSHFIITFKAISLFPFQTNFNKSRKLKSNIVSKSFNVQEFDNWGKGDSDSTFEATISILVIKIDRRTNAKQYEQLNSKERNPKNKK